MDQNYRNKLHEFRRDLCFTYADYFHLKSKAARHPGDTFIHKSHQAEICYIKWYLHQPDLRILSREPVNHCLALYRCQGKLAIGGHSFHRASDG